MPTVAQFSVLFGCLCFFIYTKRSEERKSREMRLRRFLRGYLLGDDLPEEEQSTKGIHHDDNEHFHDECHLPSDYHLPNLNKRFVSIYKAQAKQWEKTLEQGNPWVFEDEERSNWLEKLISNETTYAIMVHEAALYKSHQQAAEKLRWRN